MGYFYAFFENLSKLTTEDTIKTHYESYPDEPWDSHSKAQKLVLIAAHHSGILFSVFLCYGIPLGVAIWIGWNI